MAEAGATTLWCVTKLFTHTQLLAQSVLVHVLFFRFGDDEVGADPIVGVFRNESDIEPFAVSHARCINYPDVYWQEIPLEGPEFPYREWPDIRELFLVTEGGIGDTIGDTEIDPTALAAFVDLDGAERFAAAEHNDNVVVRKVALNTALPIPAWITGDPLKY